MAEFILTRCQFCGKTNKHYLAPAPQQLGAKAPNSPTLFQDVVKTSSVYGQTGTDQDPDALPGYWRSYWSSESGTYLSTSILAGVGTYTLCYAYGFDVSWSVVSGLAVGVGLPLLKVILYAPHRPPETGSKTIKVEMKEASSTGTRLYLDEFDQRISEPDLSKASRAMYPDRYNPAQFQISRSSLTRQTLSQTKSRLILDELKRLHFTFVTAQNKTILTPRGRALLRKVGGQ